RFQFSPDGQPGIVVQYEFKNRADQPRDLWFQLSARPDLRPVWLSEKNGITDAPDSVTWQPVGGRYLARDTRHPWFAVWGSTSSGGRQSPKLPIPASESRSMNSGSMYR